MKMTSMLVSSVDQAVSNIRRYNNNAEEVAALMPYARAWYAIRIGNGWMLGPSKFIGYEGMTVEDYLGAPYSAERHGRVQRGKNADILDGRVTEGVLRRWSESVERGHPDYDDLHTALNALCARYGKKPNNLARISIIDTEEATSDGKFSDDLVALMASVYRSLTPAQKSAFQKQIA
jgi:hypothetical protein